MRSYGVGVTTLEEVFLRVGHGEEANEQEKAKTRETVRKSVKQMSLTAEEEYCISDRAIEGMPLFWLHLHAMLRKRLLTSFRTPRTIFIEVILPTFFILFSLILQNSSNGFGTSLKYLTSYIPSGSNYFYSLADISQEASARTFFDYFDGQSQWDVQLMSLSGATGWESQGAEFNDFVFENRSSSEPF